MESQLYIDSFKDLPLKLRIELGSCVQPTEAVLKLGAGSVIELDPNPQGQVAIFAERKLIARGEVVLTNGKLAVKVTSLGASL